MNARRRISFTGALLAALAGSAAAQSGAPGDAAVLVAPGFTAWRFSESVLTDSFRVRRAWQLSVPVAASVTLGRVTLDLSGSITRGSVGLADGRSFTLSGLTDLRFRGVFRVLGDRLLLTTGMNLPVGPTGLAGHQLDALGVLGSPALGFGSPALGNGLGLTGGAVYAWRAGAWGLALGTSFEARSQYTPIETRLAGVGAPADFSPGTALRFSLGADRLIGRGRMSLLFDTEFFGQSRVEVAVAGGSPVSSRYTLGPQFNGSLLLDLGATGFRFFRVMISDRYRSRFTASDGAKAAGSSGNEFAAAVEFSKGGTRGAGLYLRADGRLDSGLEVDNTITTAAMTVGGLTLGVASQGNRTSVLPWVRAQVGRLDTGVARTTAIGYGAGLTVTVRP